MFGLKCKRACSRRSTWRLAYVHVHLCCAVASCNIRILCDKRSRSCPYVVWWVDNVLIVTGVLRGRCCKYGSICHRSPRLVARRLSFRFTSHAFVLLPPLLCFLIVSWCSVLIFYLLWLFILLCLMPFVRYHAFCPRSYCFGASWFVFPYSNDGWTLSNFT